jgi:hypothetical protein
VRKSHEKEVRGVRDCTSIGGYKRAFIRSIAVGGVF